MIRSLMKTGAAYALSVSGADQMISALSASRYMPLIIGYHQVVERFHHPEGKYIPAMRISSRMFERHLDWLGRRFQFMSLDELGARLEAGLPFYEPVAAITFDDGYRDAYDFAFPILKRKGIPSAIFVVTDLIGTSQGQVYDRLFLMLTRAFALWRSAPAELGKVLLRMGVRLPSSAKMSQVAASPVTAMSAFVNNLPQADLYRVIEALEEETGMREDVPDELLPVNWDMLAEMHRGGMIIGSHTKSHVVLPNEPSIRIHEEVRESREVLERGLGITVDHFAYPNGQFDVASVAAVASAGYRFAYTTCNHRDARYPLLTIPRTLLWENSCLNVLGRFSSAIMRCHVHHVFDLVTACNLNHGDSDETSAPVAERAEIAHPEAASARPSGKPSRVRAAFRTAMKMALKIPMYVVYAFLVPVRWVIPDRSVRVLLYHSVGDIPADQWDFYDNVPVANFERQMTYLSRRHRVVPLSDLTFPSDRRSRANAVCLTFDDGYANQFVHAYPILKRLGLPATFFVVADHIGRDRPLPHLEAARKAPAELAQALKALDWDQLREMTRDMAIGSHACSHQSIGALPDTEALDEITRSKLLLERGLGMPVDFFSYPFGSKVYGDFNETTKGFLQKAGYRAACTTVVGTNRPSADPYTFKRIPIEASDTLFDFECKISGAYDWVGPFKALFQRMFRRS